MLVLKHAKYFNYIESYLEDKRVIDPRVEFAAPCGVLDIKDALVKSTEFLQTTVEVALYLQEEAAELWTLAAAEDWQGPLFTILPAGELMLAVTYLRKERFKLETSETNTLPDTVFSYSGPSLSHVRSHNDLIST